MNKFFAIAFCITFLLYPICVSSEGEYNQAYTEADGASFLPIGTEYTLSQTFKPSINRITRIQAYLKDMAIDVPLDLKIINEKTGKTVKETSLAMSQGEGWLDIEFTSNEVPVISGEIYQITLKSNSPVMWAVNSVNNYEEGYLKNDRTKDALFTISGIISDEKIDEDNKNISLPKGQISNDDLRVLDLLTENQELSMPNITYYIHNDKRVENPNTLYRVMISDNFTIGGTGTANSKIIVEIGEKSFAGDIDENGNWGINIPLKDIKIDEYEVKAYVLVSNEKSKINREKKIEIRDVNTAVNVTQMLNRGNKLAWYLIALLILLLPIGVIIFGKNLKYKKQLKKSKRTR